MLEYIKGTLIGVGKDKIVVENNGIGFSVFMAGQDLSRLHSPGEKVKIYTYLYVREDAMQLYGFLTKDALEVFCLLITVSGIGPKGALGILSVLSPNELRFAVMAEDVKTICKAPGVGKKTASKLIIELKDKLHLEDALQMDTEEVYNVDDTMQNQSDAIEGLVALGYSGSEALKVIRELALPKDASVEDIIKSALRAMSRV